jgi:ATP-dependent DNA helicase PIF1
MEGKTYYQKIQALKEKPETAKTGSRWSPEEINQLLESIKNKDSFKSIALKHQRTEGSINSKLLGIAFSFIENGKDINEVSKLVNKSEEQIQEYIKMQGDKPKKVKQIIIEEKEEEEEPKEIILNKEQSKALEAFKTKNNIFLTGVAGAGKSVTLKKIIEYCNEEGLNFGVTATTGTAAFLIGGKTLHSYLGIGLAKESAEQIYEYLRENKMFYIIKKLKDLQVLIIDEISMLDNILFEKISKYLSLVRRKPEPFGGLQLVLTGDFCQLEPVENDYSFKSPEWKKLELETIYLKKMIRQGKDKEFQKILLELRYGNCSDETYEKLLSLKDTEFGEIKPTKLYPHNYDVDKINQKEYKALIDSGAKKVTYEIKFDCLSKDKEKTKKWAKNIEIPDSVELCVGAQVVVLANVDQDKGIVNGTRGIITNLTPKTVTIKRVNGSIYEIKYFQCVSSENPEMKVSYMPIKLAYALTIHRSQGATLDAIEIDIGGKIFAAGQAYTALSRAKDLKSIKIKDVCKESFITRKSVIKFYKKLEDKEINIEN